MLTTTQVCSLNCSRCDLNAAFSYQYMNRELLNTFNTCGLKKPEGMGWDMVMGWDGRVGWGGVGMGERDGHDWDWE